VRLTVREAAKYIPLSVSALNHMRTAGKGPRFIKLGKKILYDSVDLDWWIDAHKQSSTSDNPQLARRRRRRHSPLDVRR
jgi:hypothetical protein